MNIIADILARHATKQHAARELGRGLIEHGWANAKGSYPAEVERNA